MSDHAQLTEGHWYRDADDRQLQVTQVDTKEGLFEIRYNDGQKERHPLAAWRELRLVKAEEAWTDGPATDTLSNEEFRRATGWAEKSPDDFADG